MKSQLAIVAETPKEFTGYIGKKLDTILNNGGILRSEVHLVPIRDTPFPWTNPKKPIPLDTLTEEIQLLNSRLGEIENLQMIITLDRHPTYILTGKDGIGNWRGSILEYVESTTEARVIPTFPPSFLFSQPEYAPILTFDFKKAVRELRHPTTQQSRNYIIYPTIDEIFNYCQQMKLSTDPIICDIETRRGCISRIGFGYFTQGKLANHIMSIPFINIETGENAGNDHVWPLLRELFIQKGVIGQNFGSYDTPWLENEPYKCKINLVADTMVYQHVILPGLPKAVKPLGLAFLGSIYTNIPFYKNEAKDQEGRPPPDSQYGNYNCKDIEVTGLVYRNQINQLNFNTRKKIIDYEMAVLNGPIKDVMNRGVCINVQYKEELRERAELECEYLGLSLCKEIGRNINIGSTDQLRTLLFTELGLKPVGRKTKKGLPSTDEDTLKILGAIYPNIPALQLILKFRKIDKLRGGILSAKVDTDGRMRSSYKQTTDTGRLAASESPFRTGFALHTVPQGIKVRKMFIPDEGKTWGYRDLSQAEAYLVYYLAEAISILEQMKKGKKPHQLLAAEIAHKPYDEVGKGTKEYALGKRGVHSFHYLVSPREHVRTCRKELGINITEREATNHQEMYFNLVPEVPKWHESVFWKLKQNNMTLITPLGRERQFFGKLGPTFWTKNCEYKTHMGKCKWNGRKCYGTICQFSRDTMKKAVAFIPQSTVGDLLNLIILKWYRIKTVGELLLPVHDETDTQCWPEELEKHKEELDEAYNYPFDIGRYKNVVIPSEMEVMKNWGESWE